MSDIKIAITAASYSGNKGAAAMLQSSISQLKEKYAQRLNIYLMSVYPQEDRLQCPHDFVTIIPAQPARVLFLTFPLAILYRLFCWCQPMKKLLLFNQMLKTYADTDLVLDEAGIAFADSRGFIMNTYAFVCIAIPMLMGVPVVKYSQALGPFENRYNRLLAHWLLPKVTLIIARGKATYENLLSIGVSENVRLFADGAFTMPPHSETEKKVQHNWQELGLSHVDTVGLSISSVVARKCQRAGIDYCGMTAAFIAYLTGKGYQVYLVANAARIHSKKPRNNDLLVGDAIFEAYHNKMAADAGNRFSGLIWAHREMDAEEIRAYIGQCKLFVSSRFHAMVFALSKQVPVMLIGWSHKYREVMEQFGLEEYAIDYTHMSLAKLISCFEALEQNQDHIRKKLIEHLPAVEESSRQNIDTVVQVLEQVIAAKDRELRQSTEKMPNRQSKVRQKQQQKNMQVKLQEQCLGAHIACKMGYALAPSIRANAASGGMITALLCNLMKNKEIDGAWVVKTAFTKTGQITYQTYIATNVQQICDASSSVYMNIPMLSHLDQIRQFKGRLAVVLTPCMMRALGRILETDEKLRDKIVLKIGLFCSGAHDSRATEYALDKCHITRKGAERLYYRRGHWRGRASVIYEDGSQADFSYKKTICAYKNAYFFMNRGCFSCKDQFAMAADISFGDVWLKEMKKEPIKYTGCIIRTKEAYAMLQRAVEQGDLYIRHMSDTQMCKSQKRALAFKYRDRRWNYRLAGYFAVKNQQFSFQHPRLLKHIPMPIIYYYMCLIRLLLS